MSSYEQIQAELCRSPKTWLITGVAGFIGSNLLEALLRLDQRVVGLDNFATGHRRNLDEVRDLVNPAQWANFQFIEGDIRNLADCRKACDDVDYVLHQAALGSVPRSLEDPIRTNETNVSGFLNILLASRDADIHKIVYAASSSTYGDHPALPKLEENIGKPLSPYAVTKYVNELYAAVFTRNYGLETIGLRYFNVFGPRQDPNGAYAAVIPKWINAMLNNEDIYINGTGETSRDFCFVANVIQANILAACAPKVMHEKIFNIALGDRTSLNQLVGIIEEALVAKNFSIISKVVHREFRCGDVLHSQADITKAKNLLAYLPSHNIKSGIKNSIEWYISNSIRKEVKSSE